MGVFHRVSSFLCLLAACHPLFAQRLDVERVQSQMAKGEYVTALKSITSALTLARMVGASEPDSFTLYYSLAVLHFEIGHLNESAEALKNADSLSRLWPDENRARLFRTRSALALLRSDYEQAVQLATRAVIGGRGRTSKRFQAWNQATLALALLRQGNLPAAESAFGNGEKMTPKNPAREPMVAPRVLYVAALLHAHQGRHEAAQAACERALFALRDANLTSRDTTLGFLTLAEIHLLASHFKAAQSAAAESLALTQKIFGPKHQDVFAAHLLLAQIAERLNDTEAARQHSAHAATLAQSLFGPECRTTQEAIATRDRLAR